ncbi:ABC-2 type transporter [Desulfitobacterium dehalogenans ATCC 51507]|uniref:Transport permease protein n=1 Tax=Desulfitobacterium dehalogenans (strain ATCC 51507 / DSM 9161 / JW/IU-DC1) TaxID=756499 RepID=I4AAN5_DESDJ|nr:ABC transporter permease [Desulfitobacterium dehalogenans]AFM01020.1 ABC-2 type transporter [Desulfitobacterium dehalogenans ATCC 51507]
MINFMLRNLKIFFRDKSAVFFSLLAVFIIIGLYALFLGDVWTEDYSDIENARYLMDSWIMAGLLAVTSVTTTMGALGIMVADKARNIIKDFQSSPVSRSALAGGYSLSAFVIGVIMSIVALILAEIYILANGGELLTGTKTLQVLALILLSSLASTAILFFLASLFKSLHAFSTASTIIGTLIGFLTGIYLPIGVLPEAIQYAIKIFPISHAALLFRQILMEAPLQKAFAHAPAESLEEFNSMMGVTFRFGDTLLTPQGSILVLLVTAGLFYGLSILNLSRKRK